MSSRYRCREWQFMPKWWNIFKWKFGFIGSLVDGEFGIVDLYYQFGPIQIRTRESI